jgi:type VI secretion system secreted protein Hcp
MPIFMNYKNIPGDVGSQGHDNWIELESFEWGVGRGIHNGCGSGRDRESTTPSVNEITVSKDNDSASSNLLRASLGLPPAGEGQDVQIDFCKTDTSDPEPYLMVTLKNALVSSWAISSSGDRPTETLTLNFTFVEFKTITMDAANGTSKPDPTQYDLTKQKGS